MSIESVAIALHHSRATGTAKLVMIGIANHDGDGGAWPSIATLAKYANVRARNVQMAIARLEDLGEIRRYRQAGGLSTTADHRRPNRYEVMLHCPAWCDRTPQHRDSRKPLIRFDGELSTGVTESSPGDESIRGGVTESSPEPSLNQTPRLNERALDLNARERCAGGLGNHGVLETANGPACEFGCREDFQYRLTLEHEAVSS